MKRELYKLILVAIMIVFALSLGFFLGREVTLAHNPHIKSTNLNKTPLKQQKATSTTNPKLSAPKTQRERVNQYKQNHLPTIPKTNKIEATTISNREPVPKTTTTSDRNPIPQTQQNVKQTPPTKDKSPMPNQAPTPKTNPQNKTATDHNPITNQDKSPKNTPEAQKKQEKPSNILYAVRIKSHKSRKKAVKQSTDLKLSFPNWRFFFKQTGKTYTVYIGPFKFKRSAQRTLRKLKTKKGFASVRIEKL